MIIKNERLVKIKAVDWGWYEDSYDVKEGLFKPYVGWLYGQVIEETEDYIAIIQEAFGEGRVRKVTSIPKSAIKEIVEFERIKKLQTTGSGLSKGGRIIIDSMEDGDIKI